MSKIIVRDENFNPIHESEKHYILHNGKEYGYKEKTDDIRSMDAWLYDIFITLHKNYENI